MSETSTGPAGRAAPWRQAVELAGMMMVLVLRSSPGLVHERATRQSSADDLAPKP